MLGISWDFGGSVGWFLGMIPARGEGRRIAFESPIGTGGAY